MALLKGLERLILIRMITCLAVDAHILLVGCSQDDDDGTKYPEPMEGIHMLTKDRFRLMIYY